MPLLIRRHANDEEGNSVFPWILTMVIWNISSALIKAFARPLVEAGLSRFLKLVKVFPITRLEGGVDLGVERHQYPAVRGREVKQMKVCDLARALERIGKSRSFQLLTIWPEREVRLLFEDAQHGQRIG